MVALYYKQHFTQNVSFNSTPVYTKGWFRQTFNHSSKSSKYKLLDWDTEFLLPISCYSSLSIPPRKHQKTWGFLMLSESIERGQWHEMGWFLALYLEYNNAKNHITLLDTTFVSFFLQVRKIS